MKNRYFLSSTILFLIGILFTSAFKTNTENVDWGEYLGGANRNHYSPLTQINAQNVKNLKVAWSYAMPDSGQMQTNPIVIDGVVYGVTPVLQAFALDAATGKEIWRFGDPLKEWHSVSRGVTYWDEGSDKRILYTAGHNLWALDARTGKAIPSFGDGGKTDLHVGMIDIAQKKFVISSTPGTVFEDLIIVPTRLSEGADAAPGDIRAFNVKTGKVAWTFHTIPYPNEFGYETFPKNAYKNTEIGAANNWSGTSIDRKRGIIYVPTGSAADDFYGGNRKGTNLFANCLLALDARTGKRLWHFQTTHHDVWDRDLPAPPNLVTVTRNGKRIDAVAQVTKQGFVFVFDRVTGKPLFPIKEMPVPTNSTLDGEVLWPTQPVPVGIDVISRQSHTLTEKDINPYSENREELVKLFKSYKKGFYAPPSLEGTLLTPDFDGGTGWGGAAVDEQGIMYANCNETSAVLTMKPSPKQDALAHLPLGERTYQNLCSTCHGTNLKGNPKSNYPSLIDINKKRNKTFTAQIITNGKGMMPGFTTISSQEKQALLAFLYNEEKKEASGENGSQRPYIPYRMTGYNRFLDNKGLPALAPPWGTLNALDLNTGKLKWRIPLGFDEDLKAKGIDNTGTANYGGPVVTASGLIFIAATKDAMFRVFDAKNGRLLWETKLPAAAFATPATYMVNGKQYIVLACGGTKLGTPKGNQYVAFALR